MALKSLMTLHLMFSFVYGFDFTLRYKKQSSMTCDKNGTHNTTPLGCGVICASKYKDMCRGFLTTGSTCELCMVCQKTDQKLVLSGNVYITTPFSDGTKLGKIIHFCQNEMITSPSFGGEGEYSLLLRNIFNLLTKQHISNLYGGGETCFYW